MPYSVAELARHLALPHQGRRKPSGAQGVGLGQRRRCVIGVHSARAHRRPSAARGRRSVRHRPTVLHPLRLERDRLRHAEAGLRAGGEAPPSTRDGRGAHHPTATISPEATVDPDVDIGSYASIGAGARIGRGSILQAGVVVDERCVLGEQCILHPGRRLVSGNRAGRPGRVARRGGRGQRRVRLRSRRRGSAEVPAGGERAHRVRRRDRGQYDRRPGSAGNDTDRCGEQDRQPRADRAQRTDWPRRRHCGPNRRRGEHGDRRTTPSSAARWASAIMPASRRA